MHKLLTPILAACSLLTLPACIYNGPIEYGGETSAIWQRAPRYGAGAQEPNRLQAYRAQRYNPQQQQQQVARSTPPPTRRSTPTYQSPRSSGNRYGASSRTPDTSHMQYQPGAPRLSGSGTRPEPPKRETAPTPPPAPEPRQEVASNTPPPAAPEPREPITTTNSSTEDTLASREPAPTTEDAPDSSSSGSTTTDSGTQFNHLPFAIPVPGKTGYVNLPAPHNNLPEIDVRGIAPGTPVEIPDPNNPGSTVQFRVP